MRSIFRYPGGKTKRMIQAWINANRPHGVREYREPFVGGGGIFFGLQSGPEVYWINDLHTGLMAVYQALAERPVEFLATCREHQPAREGEALTKPGPRGKARYNQRLKEVFDSVRLNEKCDQAFRYFFVNRTVFGGRVNYDIPSRLYFSNPSGWNIVANGQLEQAAKHMEGVRVTCGDYRPLFEEDGENVWIYADPPYIANTDLTATSQLYQHSFTEQDHRELAEVFRRCKHDVCLSYDDDEAGLVREWYEGFTILEAEWRYCGTTNAKKDTGRELLILNYEPPTAISAPVVFDPERITNKMTCDEARQCCQDINDDFRTVRAKIVELHERCGWIALGYDSWQACITAEFGGRERRVNMQLRAARIESALGTIVPEDLSLEGEVQESWCREIGRLDEGHWQTAWDNVAKRHQQTDESITAALICEEVVKLDPTLAKSPSPTPLEVARKACGKLSVEDREALRLWLESLPA